MPDSICEVFLRAVSGAIALVAGTGLAYFLFIEEYLRRIEHYKERLRVYKEIHKRAAELVVTIRALKKNPRVANKFTKAASEFTEFVPRERLFMSPDVSDKCEHVVKAIAETHPDQPSELSSPPHYPGVSLLRLEGHYQGLLSVINSEIQTASLGVASTSIRRLCRKVGL